MDNTSEQAVTRDLLLAFEYAHHKEDWVTPLRDALAGVSAEEAVWKPGPENAEQPGIWQIVLHISAWTDTIARRAAQRSRGEPLGSPPEGDWPALPAERNENAWSDARQKLWEALAALRGGIETTPVPALLDCGNAGYSQFDDLLCCFIHNAYHVGQITKLREWWTALR